jgi:putative oxidoreductase
MSIFQHLVVLLARILLAAIFIWSGANQIILSWANSTTELGERNVPFPSVMLLLAVIAMLAGGMSLVLGLRARWGAVLLILFLLPTTLIMHDFWVHEPSAQAYTVQAIECLKNLGLVGGLLMVLAFGPGGFSADTFLRKKPAE